MIVVLAKPELLSKYNNYRKLTILLRIITFEINLIIARDHVFSRHLFELEPPFLNPLLASNRFSKVNNNQLAIHLLRVEEEIR